MKGTTAKAHYTTEALTTGDGRDGQGRTSDGRLDVQLALPKELAGAVKAPIPNSYSQLDTPPASLGIGYLRSPSWRAPS
jgi:hypothetical protein